MSVEDWGEMIWGLVFSMFEKVYYLMFIDLVNIFMFIVDSFGFNCSSMFKDCSFLQIDFLNYWDMFEVISIFDMFWGSFFNGVIGDWDVSKVECMFGMFRSMMVFNQDIGSWDVLFVIVMLYMF